MIKNIAFSGKYTTFQVPRENFLTASRHNGYNKILQGKDTVPGDDE